MRSEKKGHETTGITAKSGIGGERDGHTKMDECGENAEAGLCFSVVGDYGRDFAGL